MSSRLRPTALLVAGSVLFGSRALFAQPDPAPHVQPPAPQLEEAKRLFREGNALRKVGDCQRAAELYLQSRALVPSVPNTINAAYCLAEIGRQDEALELYEDLIKRFNDELTDADRQVMTPAMAALRKKIGSLEVSANARGTLVVDGRTRGELPLSFPVRVLPGKRVVRVIADGFAAFEQTVLVEVGQTTKLDAKLVPLAGSGRLRVEGEALSGAELYIDGARIGRVPWEGTLSPGKHLYWLRKGDRGSAPASATVVQGQTVLVSVELKRLGPTFRVLPEPPTAELSIDGVRVGKGAWVGALPIGKRRIEAREAGYRTKVITIDERVGAQVDMRLDIDPEHPRWGVGQEATIRLELYGGGALSNSLGSDAESACADGRCNTDSLVLGVMAGLRAGYELPLGLGFELGGGYLRFGRSLQREIVDPNVGAPATYTLDDDITMSGPFAAAGASYRISLGDRFQLTPAVSLGVAFVSARDRISGSATGGGRSVEVGIERSGTPVRSAAMFALPEIRGDVSFGAFYAGVGLGVALFLLDGPAHDTGEIVVVGVQGQCTSGTVECAANSAAVRGERAYGPSLLFVPTLRLGRRL